MITGVLGATGGGAQAAKPLLHSDVVSGTGDIASLSAVNGKDSISVDVVGITAPCDSGRHLYVYVQDHRDNDIYVAQAACYAGTSWAANLYWLPTGSLQEVEPVTCPTFEFVYEGNSTYHLEFPHTCIVEAPRRVQIYAEGTNYGGSTIGGFAGPTKPLLRSRT